MNAVQPRHSDVEPLLLSCTQVAADIGPQDLTVASGFFFQRGAHLFLVTSRHVLLDLAKDHCPQRIEFVLHAAGTDLTQQHRVSLPLYDNGMPLWRQAGDSAGNVDVAVLQIPGMAVPRHAQFRAFSVRHIQAQTHAVRVGQPLLVVGFPMGFHDTLNHVPVVRGAVVASAFGVRFQGQDCFLTDAPMQRGSSGAPVVRHDPDGDTSLPWQLLGVHASHADMGERTSRSGDGHGASPGLELAWYSDVLLALTH